MKTITTAIAALMISTNANATVAEWADPAHPEIDYASEPFVSHSEGTHEFTGWWAIYRSQSPIDDSDQIIARNISDPRRIIIVWCMEGQLGVSYNPGDDFLTTNKQHNEITYRIGSMPAVDAIWGTSDYEASANQILRSKEPETMIADMQAADKFFIRAVDLDEDRFDGTFDFAGADAAIGYVIEACK
ncbi:hypothetical protein [Paracoccus sp. (in: a-proteobacteria)]|uniref:hypothetical protein n=1 Tax=Paracoccus sp. TaxID=267 RepID=UPI004057D0EE